MTVCNELNTWNYFNLWLGESLARLNVPARRVCNKDDWERVRAFGQLKHQRKWRMKWHENHELYNTVKLIEDEITQSKKLK